MIVKELAAKMVEASCKNKLTTRGNDLLRNVIG